MKSLNRHCVIAICTMLSTFTGASAAQEPKQPTEKADTTAIYRSLGDVITLGVKLFNDQSDYAGCYRLFQGSLLTVRPVLASDMQKKIDKGLMSAEKQPTFADRAWELRLVLDDIRRQLKPANLKAGEKVEEKKAEKKQEEKKSDAKKVEKSADDKQPDKATGQLAGKLTYEGKPVAGGHNVTLVRSDKRFSSAVQKDGSFQFTTPLAPGDYTVAIEPIRGEGAKAAALPQRYVTEGTSGLSITVRSGKQQVELNLVK